MAPEFMHVTSNELIYKRIISRMEKLAKRRSNLCFTRGARSLDALIAPSYGQDLKNHRNHRYFYRNSRITS